MARIAGITGLTLNGQRLRPKGNWQYNLGRTKREKITDHVGVAGHMETNQVPFAEGNITVTSGLNIAEVLDTVDATLIMDLPSGQSVIFRNAVQVAEGNAGTDAAELAVKFEADSAELDNGVL